MDDGLFGRAFWRGHGHMLVAFAALFCAGLLVVFWSHEPPRGGGRINFGTGLAWLVVLSLWGEAAMETIKNGRPCSGWSTGALVALGLFLPIAYFTGALIPAGPLAAGGLIAAGVGVILGSATLAFGVAGKRLEGWYLDRDTHFRRYLA